MKCSTAVSSFKRPLVPLPLAEPHEHGVQLLVLPHDPAPLVVAGPQVVPHDDVQGREPLPVHPGAVP